MAPALSNCYRGAVADAGGHLGAELGDDFLAHGGLGQRAHLRHVVAHRLLAINMFAALNGRHGNREMAVVRHRDIHRINFVAFLLQQLAPIGVSARAGNFLGSSLRVLASTSHRATICMRGWFQELAESTPPIPPTPMQAWFSLLLGDAARSDERRINGAARPALVVVCRKRRRDRDKVFIFEWGGAKHLFGFLFRSQKNEQGDLDTDQCLVAGPMSDKEVNQVCARGKDIQ